MAASAIPGAKKNGTIVAAEYEVSCSTMIAGLSCEGHLHDFEILGQTCFRSAACIYTSG
jgi:hypothetical protein